MINAPFLKEILRRSVFIINRQQKKYNLRSVGKNARESGIPEYPSNPYSPADFLPSISDRDVFLCAFLYAKEIFALFSLPDSLGADFSAPPYIVHTEALKPAAP